MTEENLIEESAESTAPLLETPADGIPRLIETLEQLEIATAEIAAGHGPIAIDAERASGYRYSARAYLVQIRRTGAGSYLIDPTCFDSLDSLFAPVADTEWILHAATQDLACLREVGIHPTRLFDTEHAGRLLGKPKVGLSSLLESEMNIRLAKEHSAADWSTRPLPEPWLNYAALDVELLVELRELLLQQLIDAERKVWADEEFEYLTRWQPAVAGEDPWRRLSGIHTLRQPRQLAIARDVWLWRDEMARERDKAPGRIVPDAALVDIAKNELKSARDVYMLSSLRNRSHKNFADELWDIRSRAIALPDAELPVVSRKTGTLPPPKVWADKNPDAAARFDAVRPKLNTLAEELSIAPEVLVSPEPIRQFCWDPSAALAASDSLHPWLLSRNVRKWQAELIVPVLNTITL